MNARRRTESDPPPEEGRLPWFVAPFVALVKSQGTGNVILLLLAGTTLYVSLQVAPPAATWLQTQAVETRAQSVIHAEIDANLKKLTDCAREQQLVVAQLTRQQEGFVKLFEGIDKFHEQTLRDHRDLMEEIRKSNNARGVE